MKDRKEIQVPRIEISPAKMRAAIQRANENAKTRVVWHDRRPPEPIEQQGG